MTGDEEDYLRLGVILGSLVGFAIFIGGADPALDSKATHTFLEHATKVSGGKRGWANTATEDNF